MKTAQTFAHLIWCLYQAILETWTWFCSCNTNCCKIFIGHAGGSATHRHFQRPALFAAHVPAVLALFIRVPLVQHGMGTAQKTDLHRKPLALLCRVRPAAGRLDVPTQFDFSQVPSRWWFIGMQPVVNDCRLLQRMRLLHPVPSVHYQRQWGPTSLRCRVSWIHFIA